jgi:hypothetical protein
VSAQNIGLINAESSNTGEYEERIAMEIRSGKVLLGFWFINVSEPFDTSDFASEPSFISLHIVGINSPDDNRTVITVILNASEIVGISDGKLRADLLKTKFEIFFDVVIPYDGNHTYEDRVFYNYIVYECPSIQKFRNTFLEHKPSEGFGEIVTPDLIENYVGISFDLTRKGDSLEWWITATLNYPDHFEMSYGKEYTISLKELTGYSETIQSSPLSSNSTLHIGISQLDRKLDSIEPFKLISFKTTPSQMEKWQGAYGIVTSFFFDKTITGSSVDDLLLRFTIVSPEYIDPTNPRVIIGVVVAIAAILGIVGFAIRRKRRAREERKYIW